MSLNRHPILWILVLAAVLRFVQIGAPPVGQHAWRQSDTASVARNFHRHGNQLLYPEIDWETPGFVEMEFPIYPWTTSLVYGVVGESEAAARMLSVLGSLITIGFLYLLILRILGRRAALWAAFFYAVLPASLFFGRAIMPESWMLAASAAAVYFFLRWTDEDSGFFYFLALLATTLACLLKLTSLYLGLPLLWLMWRKWSRGTFARWQFWLFGSVVVIVLLAWYGHSYSLGQEFGASFHILTTAGADKWGTWQLLADPSFYHRVFVGYLGERILTWVGLPIFVVGLFLPRQSSLERLFDIWLLSIIVVLLVANGGSYQHDYYSLPLVLPAVAFMGKVFDRGWESRGPWLAGAVLLILILSGYRHLGALADERKKGSDVAIAAVVSSKTAPDDLVISCNGANPVWLYLSDRRGWGRDCSRLDKSKLDGLVAQGARYLVARGDSSPTIPAHDALRSYLRAFFELVQDDETTLLARLASPRPFEDLPLQTVLREDFSNDTSLLNWKISGDSWSFENGSLVGVRTQRRSEARTRVAVPPCRICDVKLSLSLSRPPSQQPDSGPSIKKPGAIRSHSRASIDLWWRDEGTGVTLTLATRKGRISLRQTENGNQLDSRTVRVALVEDSTHDLELFSNAYELELWLDGEVVLTTPNRLTSPLSGWVGIRPRRGSIQLNHLEIRVPTASLLGPRQISM